MNGYDTVSVDTAIYDAGYPTEPAFLPDSVPQGPSFFDAATTKLGRIFSSVTPPPAISVNDYPYGGNSPTLGGTIMDAIYAYGAGKVSVAQTKLRNALLNTGEGKRIVGAAQQQTIQQYMPLIIGASVGLLVLGMFLRR